MLEGKRLLITGVLTRQSIAFEVARQAQELGGEVLLTSYGRALRLTRRAAARLDGDVEVLELDVNSDEDLERLGQDIGARWDGVDGLLHAVAFSPPEATNGAFMAASRDSAEIAFRTSAFSLKAVVGAILPLLEAAPSGASVVGLDFDATVAWPNYNWMGVSKAALEAVSRYLARDLGPRGIRTNLVSAGPIRTAAASGVDGFDLLADLWQAQAPLGWDPTDASAVASAVCFLLSDHARGVTGEIVHVDGGFHAMGAPLRLPW
jgi:enoyl-[acyl-carrier protein] reductase I